MTLKSVHTVVSVWTPHLLSVSWRDINQVWGKQATSTLLLLHNVSLCCWTLIKLSKKKKKKKCSETLIKACVEPVVAGGVTFFGSCVSFSWYLRKSSREFQLEFGTNIHLDSRTLLLLLCLCVLYILSLLLSPSDMRRGHWRQRTETRGEDWRL